MSTMNKLYPLADTLQVTLHCDGKTGKISKAPTEVLKYTYGTLNLRLRGDIEASYMDGDYIAVLFHVKGDLWLYVVDDFKIEQLTIFVVDASKHLMTKKNLAAIHERHPMEAIGEMYEGLVRTFSANRYDGLWEEGNIDDWFEESSDEEDSSVDSGSKGTSSKDAPADPTA